MPYQNEHACRIHDPGKYKRIRRQSKSGKTPDMIIGVRGDGKTEVQAFRFPTERFTAEEAADFCKRHKGRFEGATTKKEIERTLKQVMREWPIMEYEGRELFLESGNLAEAKIEEEGERMYVRDVALLGATSRNKVRYVRAMKDAVDRGLYEGVRMYFMHKDGPRDVRDMFGKTVNSRFDEESQKVRSDVLVRKTFQEEVSSLVGDFSDVCGFSHVADCRWKKDEDWKDVSRVNEVLSIDLVDRPGTNRTMFEGEQKKQGEPTIMTKDELKEQYGEILEEIKDEIRAEIEAKEKKDGLEEALKENAKLKEELAKREEDDKVKESESRVDEILKDCSLPDKLKERVKERAKGQVLDDDAIKSSISDLEEIGQIFLEGVKGEGLPPKEEAKTDVLEESKKQVADLICSMWAPKKDVEKKTEEK